MSREQIVDAQRRMYGAALELHGDSPKSTLQNNRETQYLRFDRLFRQVLPLSGKISIHDVGCGLADLHTFLIERGIDHDYSGTEIVPDMCRIASNRYPGIKLHNDDFFSHAAPDLFDVVVMSGVLNKSNGIAEPEWRKFAFDLVRAMYSASRVAIAFNFLSSYRTRTDETLCYFDPREIFDFCSRDLSRHVIVDHGYPLFEATVTVFKPKAVRQHYPDPAFEKYFPSRP